MTTSPPRPGTGQTTPGNFGPAAELAARALAKEAALSEPRERWSGIAKLLEETAELQGVLASLQQDLAKLLAYPDGEHPDAHYAGPLLPRLEEELADVMAACDYFLSHNRELRLGVVMERWQRKLERFESWKMAGVASTSPVPATPAASVEQVPDTLDHWESILAPLVAAGLVEVVVSAPEQPSENLDARRMERRRAVDCERGCGNFDGGCLGSPPCVARPVPLPPEFRVVDSDETEETYGQRLARETHQTGIKKW